MQVNGFNVAIVLLAMALLIGWVATWWLYRRARQQVKAQQLAHSHVQALLDGLPDLTWVKDRNSRFLMVNAQFSRTFNRPLTEILGKTDADLFPASAAEQFWQDDKHVLDKAQTLRREERIPLEDGGEAWAETVKVPVFGDEGQIIGTAGLARDISERKRAEQHIQHLAHHDALTQLPNRVLLEILVRRHLEHHDARVDQLAVMFIDLDNFKVINDTISHRIGDKVLQAVAQRIQRNVRDEDIVARIGGDEFIVVMPFTAKAEAQSLVQALELQKPIQVESLSFDMTASVGLASYPEDGGDCWSLVQNADLAMYHAKHTGKNQSVLYNQALADRSLKTMVRNSRLIEALEKDEFSLYFQPKVDALSGRVTGFEALMRWQDRLTGEWVLPSDFIPAAERSGFIVKLGEWLIDRVTCQLAQWHRRGVALPVAINVSAVQVHQNRIAQKLKDSLSRHHLPGHLLELELTEGVMMEHSVKIIERLHEMRALGVSISIDDFGTGYSNLAYLSQFPLTSLKIDRIFVENIHTHKNHYQVASAILEMAKSLGLKVVAEGIENRDELRVMLDMGVDELQGYLFDQPLGVAELEPLLAAGFSYSERFPQRPRSLMIR